MNQDQTPFQFKPIGDGLSFHPFAEGLPYASPQKQVAPLHQNPTPPRLPVPPLFKNESKEYLDLEKKQQEILQQSFEKQNILYLLKRVLAYNIDILIHLMSFIFILSLNFSWETFSEQFLGSFYATTLWSLGFGVYHFGLCLGQEIAFKTTLGKNLFGLKIEAGASQTFIRACLFVPSLAFLGLGLFYGLFNSSRKCWHDEASGVQPL